ncbi:hypothetical protein LB505_006876 [Fusarium chuoi]|nr:hypothetical protein LB505_006876 [Fusarium chuoi]
MSPRSQPVFLVGKENFLWFILISKQPSRMAQVTVFTFLEHPEQEKQRRSARSSPGSKTLLRTLTNPILSSGKPLKGREPVQRRRLIIWNESSATPALAEFLVLCSWMSLTN